MDYLPVIAQFGWPLIILLCALFWFNRITGDFRPIFINVVGGVAKDAGSNAKAYAVAIMFGLSASLSAFYDVFSQMDTKAFGDLTWHQYAALWAKILNPFIVAALAFATKNNFTSKPATAEPPLSTIPPNSETPPSK